MKAIEGAIYCQLCVAKLPHRTPKHLAVRFPASHDKNDMGTCRGCGTHVKLYKASKVIRREHEKSIY